MMNGSISTDNIKFVIKSDAIKVKTYIILLYRCIVHFRAVWIAVWFWSFISSWFRYYNRNITIYNTLQFFYRNNNDYLPNIYSISDNLRITQSHFDLIQMFGTICVIVQDNREYKTYYDVHIGGALYVQVYENLNNRRCNLKFKNRNVDRWPPQGL